MTRPEEIALRAIRDTINASIDRLEAANWKDTGLDKAKAELDALLLDSGMKKE